MRCWAMPMVPLTEPAWQGAVLVLRTFPVRSSSAVRTDRPPAPLTRLSHTRPFSITGAEPSRDSQGALIQGSGPAGKDRVQMVLPVPRLTAETVVGRYEAIV